MVTLLVTYLKQSKSMQNVGDVTAYRVAVQQTVRQLDLK
jgi:hypothetical protein